MRPVLFKPWLVLALIFLAGVGTGVLLTVGVGSHFRHQLGMASMKQHWLGWLSSRLDLTADQRAKIDPILTDAMTHLQALNHDEMDKASRIMDAANDQISALLTPDQKVKLQQMESERQREFSGHAHSWMHSGEAGTPPPGAGGPGEPPPGAGGQGAPGGPPTPPQGQ
jgi:Spy/CpxP family protein refolding chaperone